ncbi:MAG: hypothetical protein M5U15_01370 [Kiritimatiellae bacterium]|nr:hypothetical protein [Kiritimatiellia bacterium]
MQEGDIAALSAAVNEARDPAERFRRGLAARAFAEKQFDRKSNLDSLCGWLEDCCASR